MRPLNSTAFQQAREVSPILASLSLADKVYDSPYKPKPLIGRDASVEGESMFTFEDIAFVNTSEFSKTGQYYIKNGIYTNASPIYDKTEYNAFWDEEERRRKEGYTLPGKLIFEDDQYKLQKVHIEGAHYGYLNYGEIKRSKDFEKKKGILYSPYGEALTLEAPVKRGGTTKEFSLPSFWDGDYYYFKSFPLARQQNRHIVVGKARRKGYSYKNGWVVADMADQYRRSTSVVGAYDEGTLTDDGIMNKVQNYLDFLCKTTDWNKRRLHNTLRHIEIGFRYVNDPIKRGFLSNIYTAVLAKDPGAMRGKDADLIILEEAGKVLNLAEVLEPTLKTLTDGIYMTGLMVVFGTGGGDDKYWQAFEDLFYTTYEQNFLTFDNIWDVDLQGTGCGFFHPSYMSKPGLIDEYGNSDVQGAIVVENKERAKRKNNPKKLNDYTMEEPYTPSEAFSRASNGLFPAVEIDLQLRRVLYDPDIKGIGREGIFIEEKGEVKFYDKILLGNSASDYLNPPVNDYPLKPDTDVEGCWVLWEQPYRDPRTGRIPDNLYRGWNDPFGISKEKEEFTVRDSLGTVYLYETPNNFTPTKGDRIIGEFVGRRENTEDFDRQMFLGLRYFNAMLLYENDRGDVYSNAKKLGLLDMLVDEPEFMYQKDLQSGGKGRKKGISIAANMNRKLNGAIYAKKWIITKRSNNITDKPLLNLHYVYSAGLLRELLKYDGKRNTDRVSALIVGMYDQREQLYKGINADTEAGITIEEDDYFRDLYN